jgi:hypothetical protein
MDKPSLLGRLAELRRRADRAQLDTIADKGRDGQLKAKLTEQRLLAEMEWVLDELDKLGR